MIPITLPPVTEKPHTASGYCGSMDILGGPTGELYHLVWCGQSVTDTHHLTANTLGSRNIELKTLL